MVDKNLSLIEKGEQTYGDPIERISIEAWNWSPSQRTEFVRRLVQRQEVLSSKNPIDWTQDDLDEALNMDHAYRVILTGTLTEAEIGSIYKIYQAFTPSILNKLSVVSLCMRRRALKPIGSLRRVKVDQLYGERMTLILKIDAATRSEMRYRDRLTPGRREALLDLQMAVHRFRFDYKEKERLAQMPPAEFDSTLDLLLRRIGRTRVNFLVGDSQRISQTSTRLWKEIYGPHDIVQEHPEVEVFDEEDTEEPPLREDQTHLALQKAKDRMADTQRAQLGTEEIALLRRNRKMRLWTGFFASAAMLVLGVVSGKALNGDFENTVTFPSAPAQQARANDISKTFDTSPLLPPIQSGEDLADDFKASSYSTLWEAVKTLRPEDTLMAKNVAVRRAAPFVDRDSLSAQSLASLPTGYVQIQKSTCANLPTTGAVLDCVSTQFDQNVSNQVAGEMVYAGFTNKNESLILADAIEYLEGEGVQEDIQVAQKKQNEVKTDHPEWFETTEVATQGYLPDDPTLPAEPAFLKPVSTPPVMETPLPGLMEMINLDRFTADVKDESFAPDVTDWLEEVTEVIVEEADELEEADEPVMVDDPSLEQRAKSLFSTMKSAAKRWLSW